MAGIMECNPIIICECGNQMEYTSSISFAPGTGYLNFKCNCGKNTNLTVSQLTPACQDLNCVSKKKWLKRQEQEKGK